MRKLKNKIQRNKRRNMPHREAVERRWTLATRLEHRRIKNKKPRK